MRKHFLSLLFITAIPATSLLAQEATPLSLQQSIDYALKNNLTAKNSRIDIDIQKSQNNQTTAAAYPRINGKAELDDFPNPQKQFIDGTYFGSPGKIVSFSFSLPYATSAGISGSQLLFDGSVAIALKARNAAMEFARQNSAVTEEAVRYNIIKAYKWLVIIHEEYEIVKSTMKYARSAQHDMHVTFEQGFAEKVDVERTDVQVNNLVSDSMRIANSNVVSEQALKFVMGMDINTPIVLTDTNFEAYNTESLSLIDMTADYERVPEFSVLKTVVTLNGYNLKRYQLAGLPSLSAFGGLGYNYGSNHFADLWKFNSTYAFNSAVGLQLNVPIFNGMQRRNQVWEAKLNVQKANNNLQFMKQNIDEMSSQSRNNLKNAMLQVATQKRNLELANDVLDLSEKKYKAGVGSNQEVTLAQTEQLRAQNAYFNALFDMITAQTDLKKYLGLLK